MQNFELRKEIPDLQAALGEGGLNGGQGAGVPGGAEGFGGTARGGSGDDVGRGVLGGREEAAKKGGRDGGHVAGEDERPAGRGVAEGGFDAGEGALVRVEFVETGDGQVRVALGRTDEEDLAGGLAGLGCDPFDEGLAVKGEERLVAAHAGAATAGEDVGHRSHETILTAHGGNGRSGMREMAVFGRPGGGYNQKNKSMLICLRAMAVAAAAAGVMAAEPGVRVSTTVRADARTGRLVRSTVVAPRVVQPAVLGAKEVGAKAAGASPARTTDYDGIVEEAARTHSVDPLLVHSVIRVESNYNPVAVSPKGAAGLMQLIPETARRFGASNRFDVKENITAGVKYLKYLQEMFKDDRLALAAYNAGEGAVQKYKDIPPYRETEDYVWKVGQQYGAARREQAKKEPAAKAAEPVAAGPKAEPLRGLEVETDAEGRAVLKTK